jgi:hypothetical protein
MLISFELFATAVARDFASVRAVSGGKQRVYHRDHFRNPHSFRAGFGVPRPQPLRRNRSADCGKILSATRRTPTLIRPITRCSALKAMCWPTSSASPSTAAATRSKQPPKPSPSPRHTAGLGFWLACKAGNQMTLPPLTDCLTRLWKSVGFSLPLKIATMSLQAVKRCEVEDSKTFRAHRRTTDSDPPSAGPRGWRTHIRERRRSRSRHGIPARREFERPIQEELVPKLLFQHLASVSEPGRCSGNVQRTHLGGAPLSLGLSDPPARHAGRNSCQR